MTTTVLVVDDSPVDRHRVNSFLEKGVSMTALERTTSHMTVVQATEGGGALAVMERQLPDLVVTDLRMPGMNGLELVETIKSRYPAVPVILLTAFGSEDIALLALQRGAAGYVPKRHLQRDLLDTIHNVLDTVQAQRGHQQALECLTTAESRFVLNNDPSLLGHLAGHLREHLASMGLVNPNELLRVSVALREALTNAMNHGNLEVGSGLLEQGDRAFHDSIAERRHQTPFRDRRVHLLVKQTRDQVTYVIRDEGPGFDPSRLPDPTDPANMEKASGRGLLLIRTFMDEVFHNATGNEITLVKRFGEARP